MVMHEAGPNWDITREFEGYTLMADIAFRDIKPEEYIGIFFSGGRAPEYIRYDEDLVRMPRHFFEAHKPIASVCHGTELRAYACTIDLEMTTVVDGNLVSGRTYHDHGKYMGKWMQLLIAAREQALAKKRPELSTTD